jgi:CO/xanthine dehydrogenase Mo-binding subunit
MNLYTVPLYRSPNEPAFAVATYVRADHADGAIRAAQNAWAAAHPADVGFYAALPLLWCSGKAAEFPPAAFPVRFC